MSGVIVIFILISMLSMGAVVAAIVLMASNKNKYNSQVERSIRAEVVKTDNNVRSMSRLNHVDNYDHTQFFIEFRDDSGNRITLNCNKRTYETLLPGFYGDLVYKGTRLVSFIRLNEHEERRIERKNEDGYFFQKSTPKSNPIHFYCDAPSLGVKIPSESPMLLDVDEVVKYVNSMLENKEQNFFGLDNKLQVIQFFNEGVNSEILIDIPDVKRNGSYQAIINGVNKTKSIVRAYYNNEDVFELADFDFMKF